MVNFRKLSSRAQKAKDLIDQQGGTDALKDKAGRMKGIAGGKGSVSDKAKAAAQVAREKPKPEDQGPEQ
ncbi:MAG: hypothetical protein U0R51_01800 [Solirubrobacterales bacterium]